MSFPYGMQMAAAANSSLSISFVSTSHVFKATLINC